jgi:uncharacterized membrane protein YdjX (TVP38/TMEM64 family)
MLRVRRSFYWQVAALLIAVAGIFALSRFFPVVDLIETLQQRVMSLGTWAAIWYPLLFAACNVLLLPAGILAVGSGFFFGLWWGFLIVFAGNIIGTAISFALSRSIAARCFREKLSRNLTLRALGPAVERESWKIILLSQLHPLFPTSLLNYFYGLTRIRFASYMLWAAIGRAPGLFLYVYVGTLGQLAVRIMRGENYPRSIEYWIWGGVFLTTILLFIVLGRLARNAIQTSNVAAAAVKIDGEAEAKDVRSKMVA